jgi:hypothetical protein
MREIEAPLLLTMHYLTTTKPAALSAAKLRHSLGQRARHGTVLQPAERCAEQLGPWRGVHRGDLDARELAMAGCSSIAYLSNHSCSCLAPLLERRAPHAWANPVLRLDRRLRTGGQRAGHTTQENVRCAEIASIEKQGPLSVRRSSCLQHGAAWHAYLLMCTVTISPCPWLRARITCNEDDGREQRAFDSVSAESERGCVRTIALRCVADPQHLRPPLFGPSGPSPSEKNARGLGSFKTAS